MKTPSLSYREIKKFDWFGWIMAIIGLCLMAKFGGVGWIFGNEKDWWMVAIIFFCFWEYVIRISFGKVKTLVYYDSIIHRLYEIEVSNGETYYVSADNEEELALYMESTYPELNYKIVKDTHTESFIKTEKHFN